MSLILTTGKPCSRELWETFIEMLSSLIEADGCDARTLRLSAGILACREFLTVDVPATLASFEARGGFCDCEVLMNVVSRPLCADHQND